MQSETIGALAAALAKAQGEISPATMDRTAKITQTAGYKYATLTSLWESARTALSANGLAVTQVTDFDTNGDIVLLTTLLHSSGEWISGVYPIRTADTKPQTLGSALTYARRYALGALVGLTSDDDDDGTAANNGTSSAQAHHRIQPAKPAPSEPPSPFDNDEEQDEDRAFAMRKFHAVGADLYGSTKEWDAKRPGIVEGATQKRTKSSRDMTTAEIVTLTGILEKRVKARGEKVPA
jgi:hypothetical protein